MRDFLSFYVSEAFLNWTLELANVEHARMLQECCFTCTSAETDGTVLNILHFSMVLSNH